MAPVFGSLNVQHLVRRAHPLRVVMGWTSARLELASAEELRRDQERRLRRLVRWAAVRSPFYRRWFAESGVDPRSIRSLSDLERLPLLQRRDLAERPEEFLAYPRRLVWAAHSSGTSATPVTVYRTLGSSVYELSVLERQWAWFSVRPGARRAVLRGSGFASDNGDLTRKVPGNNQLLVSSFHLQATNLPAILADLRAFRPEVIEGWPSSIALLTSLMQEAGEQLPVTAVITSSEVMSGAKQASMREVFSGPVVDHYGQTERAAMAGSCEAGGYHVFPDYGIVELVPTGPQRWEIVGTPLHNWGFPLFRYRTGDEVGPAPEGPCPCGRAFPSLGSIDGRVEDAFTAADGRTIPLPSSVVDDLTGVREAQIVQHAPGKFEIRVVPGLGFDRTALEALARRNVARFIGPNQTVTFQVMDRLPRGSSGKLKPTLVVRDQAG